VEWPLSSLPSYRSMDWKGWSSVVSLSSNTLQCYRRLRFKSGLPDAGVRAFEEHRLCSP
jgi:hypothetical protein